MWKFSAHDLMHPESLSENQLREILKTSCIENHKFEKLCKSELVEMYKRIAMPLPQRRRTSASNSDAKADAASENSITDTSDSYTNSLTTDLNKGNKRACQSHPQNWDQLKPNDQVSTHKKIRIYSAPKVDTVCNGSGKRRCNEQKEELLRQKRQKITWP